MGSDFGSRKSLEASGKPAVRMLMVCQILDKKDKNTGQLFVPFPTVFSLYTEPEDAPFGVLWQTDKQKYPISKILLYLCLLCLCRAEENSSAPGIKSTCPGSICYEHAPKVPSRCCCFEPPPSTPHPTLQNRINCCLSANFQEHSLSTLQSQKHRKLFAKVLSCLMLEESCCLQNPSSLIHSENISEEKNFKD